jgi:hypothetical protein
MKSPTKSLPWSLRQKLVHALRDDLIRHAKSATLGEVLAGVIDHVGKVSREPALRTLAKHGVAGEPLAACLGPLGGRAARHPPLRGFVRALLGGGRARLGARARARRGAVCILPRIERERIEKRFERVWTRSIDRHDDDGELSEYTDALDEELERIGHKNEQLSIRVLTWRFADASGTPRLTLAERIELERPTKPEQILGIVERELKLVWIQSSEPVAELEVHAPRVYDPSQSYAVGERVEHAKFGMGTVLVSETARVRIRFPDAERTLALRAP